MKTTRYRGISSLLLALSFSIPAAPLWAQPPQNSMAQGASLYKRLGGYDAIAAVTDATESTAVETASATRPRPRAMRGL